jgi:hypothetical protein
MEFVLATPSIKGARTSPFRSSNGLYVHVQDNSAECSLQNKQLWTQAGSTMNWGAAVIVTVIVPISKMHYDRERFQIRHGYQANYRSYSEST